MKYAQMQQKWDGKNAYVEEQRTDYRKRAHGKLFKLNKPMANGCDYGGVITMPDGSVWQLEARVVTETIDGKERKHFAITPFHALLRNAKVEPKSDPAAIPDDLIARMEAPFDDPLPPFTP